jgi:hypothetical protein
MVASGESRLRLCVAHAEFGNGFFVALVPAVLPPDQVESPCRVREQAPILWKKRKKSCPPVMIAFAVII